MFTAIPIERKRSDRVADQLETLILDNALPSGERLPPENELARQYGVSRTVIREAVRSLAAKGLVHVAQGSGTVVRGMTNELASQSISTVLKQNTRRVDIEKLLEVRRMLEVEIAGLAAERRTDADLKTLDETMLLLEREGESGFVENDIAFHAALAHATHNEFFEILLESLADALIQVRRMALKIPETPRRAFGHHRAIQKAVVEGDSLRAREAMAKHLSEAEATARRAGALKRKTTHTARTPKA